MTSHFRFPRLRSPFLCGALALFSIAGCATGKSGNFPADAAARAAGNAPAVFTFVRAAAGETCRSPAIDPRDSSQFVLASSGNGRGDYEVPSGRYGVGAREYLRLVCATGAVVGVVPR